MSKSKYVRLTTVDNPFDPIKEFDQWYRFDEEKGYCTLGLIARLSYTSPNFSDKINNRLEEMAIDEILEGDMIGLYKKVVGEVED